MYLAKATLLSKWKILQSFQSATYLTQCYLTSTNGTEYGVTQYMHRTLALKQHTFFSSRIERYPQLDNGERSKNNLKQTPWWSR